MLCAGFVALVMCVAVAAPAAAAPQVVALAASLTDVLDNIRNWLVGLLASLATVFFTVGGVRYLAADGDPGEIGKAKQAFKSAALGYGLAALAPILVEILKGIVGAE
jgi:succinate dehydrogenase/fumarate reductase cytochrome b subunit